jgi:tetratricopeptide (TPR) repeat protein
LFRPRFIFISLVLLPLGQALAEDAAWRLQQAGTLLREGKVAQAVTQLDGLRNGPALSPLDLFQLGWLYGQARKYDLAINIFLAVPENVPDPLTRYYAIALSHFSLGHYQQTVDVLSQAKSRGFTDSKSANLLGVAYAQLGEAEKAYGSLRDGISENPTDAKGYLNLVTLCVEFHNNPLAEKIATRGLEFFPRESRLHISRGAVRMLGGQVESARDDFGHAIELAPHDADASFFAGLAEYQLGRHAAAIAVLRKAVRGGVADPDVYYLLAESLLRANPDDAAGALRELDSALNLDTRSVPALVLRAKLRLKVGRAADATADLERARTIEPDSRSVTYGLARAYAQLGRQKEANQLYDKVREEAANSVAEMGRKKLGKTLVERPPE